jgi:FkbM family methyltransferase
MELKLIPFKSLDLLKNILIKLGIKRSTPYVGKVYDFLIRKLWPYEKIIEIQDSKMLLDINDESIAMRETFSSYAFNKIHERVTTESFKKVVKEGDIVVDLGANIGYFTLLAAKLVGKKGKVFAFEPEPKNFNYLTKNIKLNNYTNVVLEQKAVSDRAGKIKLFLCPYDSGHHTINQPNGIEAYRLGRSGDVTSIDIETVTLDGYLKGEVDRVDVIKIDVEGAEMLALLGMDGILRSNQNIKMFVEFFPLLIKKMGSSPEEFIRKLLEDYKFSIYVIPDDYDAVKGEMKKLNSVNEVMSFRKKESDHINLFIKK